MVIQKHLDSWQINSGYWTLYLCISHKCSVAATTSTLHCCYYCFQALVMRYYLNSVTNNHTTSTASAINNSINWDIYTIFESDGFFLCFRTGTWKWGVKFVFTRPTPRGGRVESWSHSGFVFVCLFVWKIMQLDSFWTVDTVSRGHM